jgi:hypothetical protein
MRNCERAKCYIELGVGDWGTGNKGWGEFIFWKEAGESTQGNWNIHPR